MNQIKIDLERTLGHIERNLFGGFAEHLGRCIYGGIYEPGSPLADADGFRTDVMDALKRLRMPVMRYPGGNFVSGYRWRDGVGPVEERPARSELAWQSVETNHFGTNEFIQFCRKLGTEPYLAVNCGDGDMREARDWVEYCNGTNDTALVKLRRQHGFPAPHNVRYWGVGNEVDGHWQIGYKTPQEYARSFTEFAKMMKWVDPEIKLIASALSDWKQNIVERAQLLLEQSGRLIDYMSLHWYIGNPENDFEGYMAIPELLETRLFAYEGLIKALRLDNRLINPIWLAVDEWNVWYRTHNSPDPASKGLEEQYNLEDALAVAMQMNVFIRHANYVKMANIAQIVNVIAPIFTRPDGLFLQTIFHPFEIYSSTCGSQSLDVYWQGETFSTKEYAAVRVLDVAATLDPANKQLVAYVVNRSRTEAMETTISLKSGLFAGEGTAMIINGADIKTANSFESPEEVNTRHVPFTVKGDSFNYVFEPHSVTALVCPIA